MLSDCRKGECGLCEVRIAGLEGDIDHRDVFYSERQRDARPDSCHLSADSAVVGRSALIFRGSGSAGYALTAAI